MAVTLALASVSNNNSGTDTLVSTLSNSGTGYPLAGYRQYTFRCTLTGTLGTPVAGAPLVGTDT